jgi:PPK2 family polyphosphate:nucleotide phosphotransferase
MDRYRVKPSQKIRLADFDPEVKSGFDGSKEDGVAKLQALIQELDQLQGVLYAEHKRKVLIVLQAMDTAGKDGVIRKVFEGVNPTGVRVSSFKVPTPLEADHDYLWRIHAQVPAKGEMVIFNRSHYEQVLVVRVHSLEPSEAWRAHYQQICDFERMMVEEGATILKFFLNITKDEQKKRLLERIDMPEKRWKFSSADLSERKLWDQYMQAYQELLNETSTAIAPWYIVPANHNWYRDLVVASVLVKCLQGLDMHYPEPAEDVEQFRAGLLAEK